jgi:AsmA protein
MTAILVEDCTGIPHFVATLSQIPRVFNVNPTSPGSSSDQPILALRVASERYNSSEPNYAREAFMQRRWVKVAAAVTALVVLVVLVVPFLVNADTFRPTLEDQLSSALGRQITLGHLSFSLLSGSLIAENISIADDPAFSTSPFLDAKSFYIGVEVMPLLFHHQIRVTKLTIDSPSIHIIHAENGKWNFSSLGGTTARPTPSGPSAIPDLTVGELKIKDGSATVSSLPAVGKPFVYTGVNLTVQQFSFLKSFPFQLSAKLPGSGTFDLRGNAGPFAQKNAADTPFRATLDVKHFDPVAAGVIDSSKGISMVVDLNAQLTSDGANLTSTGKIQAAQLQLARTGSPSPQPVNIDYSIRDNLNAQTGSVSDIAIHAGTVAAHVTGSYRLTPQAIVLDLRLAAPNLPIDQLEQLLPAFGVRLPSGSSLHGGTLTANLAVTGPATATTIAGPVEIDNTQLAGFDLGSRIQGLNPFGGSAGGTAIQTVRTDVNSSPQSTQFANIYANLPQVGTASGGGTVSPSGALDFQLVAKFNSSTGVGAVANQAMNAVSGFVGGFLHSKTKSAPTGNAGIPLTITGTASNPSIRANLRAMLK